MKHRYYSITADKDRAITTLAYAANLLTDNNPSIRFFADVDDVDVRSLYMSMERRYGQTAGGKSVSNIMRVFSILSVLMEYLMSDHRDEAMRSPVPHDNPFSRYRFHNAKDYKVRTAVIPEAVAEQIDAHLDELDPVQALLYRIFSATGMRMKEVLFLEADCLEPSQYEGAVQLKYKQYKTLTARRKAGVPDYHRVLILKELADEISGQIHKTKEWRKELGVPYLFVNKRPNFLASMISMSNYMLVINRLIKKYDLRDENGRLWHFTSKQQRKTLTVTLIENGASVDELAYWLGHLSRNTASNYYAEVRK
jgi:integrase